MSAPELCRDGESLRFAGAAIKRKICIKRNPVKWTTNVHLETSQSCNVLIAICKQGLWPDIWNREQILLQTANEQSINFLKEHRLDAVSIYFLREHILVQLRYLWQLSSGAAPINDCPRLMAGKRLQKCILETVAKDISHQLIYVITNKYINGCWVAVLQLLQCNNN